MFVISLIDESVYIMGYMGQNGVCVHVSDCAGTLNESCQVKQVLSLYLFAHDMSVVKVYIIAMLLFCA